MSFYQFTYFSIYLLSKIDVNKGTTSFNTQNNIALLLVDDAIKPQRKKQFKPKLY